MKNHTYRLLLFSVLFTFLTFSAKSQCANTNALYLDLTPTGVGNTQSSVCTYAGDYNTFTACLGASYTITTCGSAFDTRITLYEDASGVLIGSWDTDDCPTFNESVTWVSTLNGVVRVLVDEWNCAHNSTCGNCNVTQNTACAPVGGGDNCAGADRIACGDPVLVGETTIGNTNTATNWNCYTPITTPGEDHYYVVQWPDAAAGGSIRLNFTNVVDANDTYLEVLALGNSCAANTCVDGGQLTVATGLFGTALNFYEYSVPAGITDYYFVVDAQNDGITSYDLQVTCFTTGIMSDLVNNCTPIPVTAAANQGYYQTWDGAEPPVTQDPAILTGTYTVCENIYMRNAGWEWLKYFNVTLGTCWINTSNYTPNGVNTGFHSLCGAAKTGSWTAALAAGVISWTFVHPTQGLCGNLTWGDGNLLNNNYTCALYSFCYDAQVDPACTALTGFQNGIVAIDDGIGGGGGGTVSPSNVTLGTTSPTLNNLPITLISFNAEAVLKDGKYGVILNWKTASEINNDYFTIERSVDGINFEELFQMKGVGTSTDINNYVAVDEKPKSGINYYRLKQTDFNGKFEYFNVVPVDISNFEDIRVYPSPVQSELTVDFVSKKNNSDYVIKIYDIRGVLVYSEETNSVKGRNQPKIDTKGFSSGLYILIIENNNETHKINFIKK